MAIKYAVVREDPAHDSYLEALLQRVDRKFVISGIGERPAIGTCVTGSCRDLLPARGVLPALEQSLFAACEINDFEQAEELRAQFITLEDRVISGDRRGCCIVQRGWPASRLPDPYRLT